MMVPVLAIPASAVTLAQFAFDWSRWAAPFSSRWWLTAACSALVGVVCGVLGCFVVLRRMALIGDALSHAVLPGVVAAFLLLGVAGVSIDSTTGAVSLMAGALAAGLVTSVLISVVSRHSRAKEDAAIGIVFTAMFAAGVILISGLPRSTHFDLKCFLFGEPLAVRPTDLAMLSAVASAVLVMVVLFFHPLKLMTFDPTMARAMGLPVGLLHYLLMGVLAAAVVAGLTTTGVVMVVAMVVTPAAAAYQWTDRFGVMLVLAGALGMVSAVSGMSLAFVSNWPAGPSMVVVASLLFGVSMLASPRHGLLVRLRRRRRADRHYRVEDLLKAVFKLGERGAGATVSQVAGAMNVRDAEVRRLLRDPASAGLAAVSQGDVSLTPHGRERAAEMVRAHRLWESYLASQARIDPRDSALHQQAERLEHAHELVDELDQALGHPQRDPHGEDIPRGPGT